MSSSSLQVVLHFTRINSIRAYSSFLRPIAYVTAACIRSIFHHEFSFTARSDRRINCLDHDYLSAEVDSQQCVQQEFLLPLLNHTVDGSHCRIKDTSTRFTPASYVYSPRSYLVSGQRLVTSSRVLFVITYRYPYLFGLHLRLSLVWSGKAINLS